MKRHRSTARAHHGRRVRLVGVRGSAFPVRVIIYARTGQPVAAHNRDYAIAWFSRGELRKLRDCADRILGERPRKRKARK